MTLTRRVSSPSSYVLPTGREPPSPNSRSSRQMANLLRDGLPTMTRLKILCKASVKPSMNSSRKEPLPKTLSEPIEHNKHQLGGWNTGAHLEYPLPSQPLLYGS